VPVIREPEKVSATKKWLQAFTVSTGPQTAMNL